MRVALLALTNAGAAGDYVTSLATAMSSSAQVVVWAPGDPVRASGFEPRTIAKPATSGRVAAAEAMAIVRPSSLAQQVSAGSPDVVHFVFGEGYPSAARAAAALTKQGRLVATTWHDPHHHGQLLDRLQHSVATRTVGASAGLHVHCGRLVPPRISIPVLVAEHPAFECRLCAGIATTQALRHDGTILSVGRFAPYKGLDVLCRALDRYWDRGGVRQFAAIGQGRVPRSMHELRDRWPSRVSIENAYVSTDRLHDAFSAAATCVLPYVSGTQSALPWLARMHGAHLITTDVGCLGETARRIGARVVAPGSATELMNALLEDPSRWLDHDGTMLPTFAELSGRLLRWYETLDATGGANLQRWT